MSPRLRRLYNEFREVSERFSAHPHIVIQEAMGDPPEHYKVEYRIKGLTEHGGKIEQTDRHVAEIILMSDYPRREPMCRMLTPVFHPNISHNVICIADNWTADQSLTDVIIRIGEMIAYQNYNTQSPRNGEAANWAKQHIDIFPIDDTNLSGSRLADTAVQEDYPLISADALITKPVQTEEQANCQNCGTRVSANTLIKCSGDHFVCEDCVLRCNSCGVILCVLCSFHTCGICRGVCCTACVKTCSICKQTICRAHLVTQTLESDTVCQNCTVPSPSPKVVTCSHCGFVLEDPNANYCIMCGIKLH